MNPQLLLTAIQESSSAETDREEKVGQPTPSTSRQSSKQDQSKKRIYSSNPKTRPVTREELGGCARRAGRHDIEAADRLTNKTAGS